MYNFKNTSAELSLQPLADISKISLITGFSTAAIMLFLWFYPLFHYETTLIIISVGGIILLRILFEILFQSRTQIIFDKQQRKVYKKYGGLFKRKLYDFGDVRILSTDECGGDYYGISHRKNRYGKSHAISDHFPNDAVRLQYEHEILTEIQKILRETRTVQFKEASINIFNPINYN